MKGHKKIEKLLMLGVSGLLVTKTYRYLKSQHIFKRLKHQQPVAETIPTLLVHGTNGTRRSLGGMIDRWHNKELAYKALEVEVSKDSQLKFQGDWQTFFTHKNPLVQVIFKEGDPPEWQQGAWLKQVMVVLKEQLAIQHVNIMGHSMGGVAGLRYLSDYGQDPTLPKVAKLALVGAPFNGEFVSKTGVTDYDLTKGGPQKEFATFSYFKDKKARLPKELKILMIYGDLKNGSRSDGFVSVASAQAVRFLVNQQRSHYREKAILGLKAQHSLLHENTQVDRLVAHFLWN